MNIRTASGFSTRRGYALEDLCRDILKAHNWQIDPLDSTPDYGIDITATEPTTRHRVAFEVKYTRNATFPTSALIISAERLIEMASAAGVDKAVLIVAADIRPEIKNRIQDKYNLQILNLNDLISLASIDLELLEKLVQLCEIDLSESKFDSNANSIINPKHIELKFDTTSSNENERIGRELIDKLQSIPLGRDGCYAFEDTASEILKYLFNENLTGWHQQKRTTDDLHRYDLICRVIDNSTIWKFISQNLDSRYVLFEFKNYKEQIGQSQVYSTEKYLYEKAKRKVCFLISRVGASDNALIACQGAMREHGKLIICLDDKGLTEMINCKVSGDDANELLFEKVDKFLMELPR